MGCIVKCKSGKYTYLYESASYRDKNGKPQNKRICIGRIDPKTGQEVYKPEYLEKVWGTENQPNTSDMKLFSENDIKMSQNKELGVSFLINRIASSIGLTEILRTVLPNEWEQVLTLASYMVASGEPAMYCEDWLHKTESIDASWLTSQKISQLLISISEVDRSRFYEAWGAKRSEEEYFALDITSVSSYSEMISDVGWGYNRDGENLAQINICMLVGENSKLPIYQAVYNGALKDVSTLKTTLAVSSSLELKNIAAVMDKGFGSKSNIDSMLSDVEGIRFLIALPFTMKFTKTQVESERKDIDTVDNTIVIGDDVIRGVTKIRAWSPFVKIYTHIYFNAALAYQKRNTLYGKVARLREAALVDPYNKKFSKDFSKYLCVRKSSVQAEGVTVTVRKDVLDKELAHAGWMVAVSNFIDDAKTAILVYRAKDVVEKTFLRLKNCLDLARLRVHGDNAMQNKIFVGFIALIITARIHNVMDVNDMYKNMTMRKMLKSLETLRVQYINGKRILYPPTALHKEIFTAFGFELPV